MHRAVTLFSSSAPTTNGYEEPDSWCQTIFTVAAIKHMHQGCLSLHGYVCNQAKNGAFLSECPNWGISGAITQALLAVFE